jgi:hypothetical protein
MRESGLRQQPTIHDIIRDWFPTFLDPSWTPWRTYLGAVFGLELDADEIARYRQCTGRHQPPDHPAREVWTIVGRRGGKSRVAALLTVYLAVFRRYTLAPGERGVVMVLAADRQQARVVMRYIGGLVDAVPALAAKVTRRTAEAIDFNNGISVEIHTSSFRSVRGYTVVAAILDEVAYWPTDESATPDAEVVTALRPAMATVPGALLVAISSPYAQRGELYRAYRDHFGIDGDDVLVWQADTRTMNPALDPTIIERAYAADGATASAEWGARFRPDVERFLARDVVERVTTPGCGERPPASDTQYYAFCDPAGGSGTDSMTLAVGHSPSAGVAVLDVLRDVTPPFSPAAVTAEFAAVLQRYGVTQVTGDRFGGEFPREVFRTHGIEYIACDRTKSALYQELLALVNSDRVELLDLPRLRAQLIGLERRTTGGGKDVIDHGWSTHDDLANSCAGVLVEASRHAGRRGLNRDGFSDLDPADTFEQMVTRRGSYFPGD